MAMTGEMGSGGAGALWSAEAGGVELGMRGGSVASVKVRGRELATGGASGFGVRDVAADSGVYGFAAEGERGAAGSFRGRCGALGVGIEWSMAARGAAIGIRGRVTDLAGRDRAITLNFALPMDLAGWRWGDDIRRSREIGGAEGAMEYIHPVRVGAGATGTQSQYPLAAVYDSADGLALAMDLDRPGLCRLSYHAGMGQFRVAYDFGLVGESRHFPGSADFSFVLYRFEPAWGFRGAFAQLMDLFPESFAVRARKQGIWMPFTDIATVGGWEDFGFQFHEGASGEMLAFDVKHGIDGFQYIEPMTWWMPMDKETPRTAEAALAQRDRLAEEEGDSRQHQQARVSRTSAMMDAEGKPFLQFHNLPWCDGAVWSLNPNPYLEATPSEGQLLWNEQKREQLFGEGVSPQLAGMYLDSLEGYVTADLNFRREHFVDSTVPLTFCPISKKPALLKGLAVYEFTRFMSEQMHGLGKLLFANGVPYTYAYLCPPLDLLGTEADWMPRGSYEPTADAQMCVWRTMSGAKPYLLLMNTNFNAFTAELVERYLQHSLFFGFYPSMFSFNAAADPYWKNPAWYNRDRELFRKYIPIVKRVAEAGWNPITAARSDNPGVWVERFGSGGGAYLTIFNPTAEPQRARITLEGPLSELAGDAVGELVSGKRLDVKEGEVAVTLAPYAVAVLGKEG